MGSVVLEPIEVLKRDSMIIISGVILKLSSIDDSFLVFE
jgi:hypothetical protein